MIVTDVSNNQDTQQNFAYITQVKDDEDVTISLSWLTGSLSPRQSLSPEQSWILTESRTYHIQEHIIFKNISYSRTYHIQVICLGMN